MKHQYKPLLLLSLMFLMVGALFCMNDILLPSLITYFKLNYTQATMIQFSFYLTYIIFPIPIAWMIHKYGYKVSLLTAVLVCALGCIFFLPAKYFDSYPLVLVAIFIISTGLTIINVAANPFAALLGDPGGAHQRINFVQVFSRVGYAATPVVATTLIYNEAGQIRYHFPYLLLALSLLVIAFLMFISHLPSMKPGDEEKFTVKGILKEAASHKHLFYGVFAMFFYMGAEACTAGFFIPYLKSVLHFSDSRSANYLSLYYVLTAGMGMLAVFMLKYIKAHKLVGVFGLGMMSFYIVCIFLNTGHNEYFLAGLGIFLSIMFPTLFSLAIDDIGTFTGKGSALLNFALIGGSVFPPLQGLFADKFGVQVSYVVPLICFVMITTYAFFFTREPILKRNRLKTLLQ
ncbi:MAG: MFS transporter [Bacteroidetes bacterium]|nr:MFS transporter [Bacteroidota bacterium]MBS1974271.1 MFS transporter [Bacteroidota bacterium]